MAKPLMNILTFHFKIIIMKKILLITALLTLFYGSISAQISNDVTEEYNKLKDSIDAQYLALKKAIWKEFEAIKTEANYKKPKPKVPPKIKPDDIPDKPKPVAPNPIVVKPKPKIKLPIDDFSNRRSTNFEEQLIEIAANSSYNTNVDFYGASFRLYYDNLDFDLQDVSHKSILSSFKYLLDEIESVDNIIVQLVEYALLMQLNDYSFMKLVRKTALKLYKDVNKANLFTWTVMNINHYDCKLAYTPEGNIFLLIPSNIPIYRTVWINMNGKRYYAIAFNLEETKKLSTNLRTYADNPLKSDKTVDFVIAKVPKISKKIATRDRIMPNIGKTFSIKYNKSYVNLLKDMPILDYAVYFHIPMSASTYSGIKRKFEPYLAGKTDVQKVSFLLAFVQQGFPYKYDMDNFGRSEQPLSPEEVLYYTHCDCEDHAALFAYLVTTLTDCEVMGVLYRDHATTAVKFKNARPRGYYLPEPYSDYILCESTVSGGVLPIGIVGRQYIGVAPERVFKINKKFIMQDITHD